MLRESLFVLLVLVAGTVLGDGFESTVTIHVSNAKYKAKMTYWYDRSSAYNNHYLRYDYTSPISMIELIDYNATTRYKDCGTCESSKYGASAPEFFSTTSDVKTNTTEGDCVRYTRAKGVVSAIWLSSSQRLCKAEMTDGRIIEFSDTKTKQLDAISGSFKLDGCPKPVCRRVMDLVFVLDTSGSIYWSDWLKVKQFVVNMTNSFDIGPEDTMIGIATYGTRSRKVLDLSGNKNEIIQAANSAYYYGSCTCTGCGISTGIDIFRGISQARASLNPEKVMIVLTDGYNNEPDYLYSCTNYTVQCATHSSKKEDCVKWKCKDGKGTPMQICKKYGKSNTCKTRKCEECESGWKSGCAYYDESTCTKKSSTVCANYTNYCLGSPSGYCCRLSGGTISTYRLCDSGLCYCAAYRCKDYACEEHACLQKGCDSCSKRSNTECVEYESVCLEYETQEICDEADQECAEFKCTDGYAVCTRWGLGANANLTGAIALMNTQFALNKTTERIPTIISIGVGSGVGVYELLSIASSVEGSKLYYSLQNFDELAKIITDLVDVTCTSQIADEDTCSDNCKGFCGCGKTCYCPVCNTGDNCTSYTCDSVTKGCFAKEKNCGTETECSRIRRNPLNSDCCEPYVKDCTGDDKCMDYKCSDDITGGCYSEPKVCPEYENGNKCRVLQKCDSAIGCVYGDYCTKINCQVATCTIDANGDAQCSYKNSYGLNDTDLCNPEKCDTATGLTYREAVKCVPKNGCYQAECVNGSCVETLNMTKAYECENAEGVDECSRGFCDITTGDCKVEKYLDGANCDKCSKKNFNETCEMIDCVVYGCGVVVVNDTTNASVAACVPLEDRCKPDPDDPCTIYTCVGNVTCIKKQYTCPQKDCYDVKCIPNPENKTAPFCDYTPKYPEDACYEYQCDAEGNKVPVSKCPKKPCSKLISCTINETAPDGRVCEYYEQDCTKLSNGCTIGICSNETDRCVAISNASNCQGDDPCVVYTCDLKAGCKAENYTCPSDDPCAPAQCFNVNGTRECRNVPLCTQTKYCENVTCIRTGANTAECKPSDFTCDNMNTTGLDRCHIYKCDETRKRCKISLISSSSLDVCGKCIEDTNVTESGDELGGGFSSDGCISGMKLTEFAATLSGAAIAGIVIAVIVAVAIISVTSAIGTRELIRRSKLAADQGATSNPIYEEDTKGGDNPMFSGEHTN